MEWFYEDFVVGQTFTTRPRVITATEMDLLPILSGATNPAFLSDEAAKSIGRPRRLVTTLIPLSLSMGQTYQTGVFDKTTRPVEMHTKIYSNAFEGDTLKTEVKIVDKKDDSGVEGQGLVIYLIMVKNQNGEPILEWNYTLRVLKGPKA